MSLPIGHNIKKLRNEQKITQEQLAEHLSISCQAVSKWENNVTVPDVALLPVIAEFFKVSIDELFKPNMKAYRNKEARLLSIYEHSHSTEDFNRADQAYQKLLLDPTQYTHDDLMFYAILQDYRSGDYVNKAIDYYNKAIAMGESVKDANYYKTHRQLIGLLARNSRSQESIDKYNGLLEKEPKNFQNCVSLSLAYYLAKDYDNAWKVVQDSLVLDADNALLLNLAGEISKKQGRFEEAIAFWDRSYALDHEMPDNLFSKVFLYQGLGEKEKAVKLWEEIIQWLEQRGLDMDLEWPKREMAKLLKSMEGKESQDC